MRFVLRCWGVFLSAVCWSSLCVTKENRKEIRWGISKMATRRSRHARTLFPTMENKSTLPSNEEPCCPGGSRTCSRYCITAWSNAPRWSYCFSSATQQRDLDDRAWKVAASHFAIVVFFPCESWFFSCGGCPPTVLDHGQHWDWCSSICHLC